MKGNYFRKSTKIFITAGFLALLSVNAYAQTAEDKKLLRENTNLESLRGVKSKINRTVVTEARLKKFAESKKLPYRLTEKDGKVIQLVAIDGAGNPIYLATNNERVAITSGVNFLHAGGDSGYDLSGKDVKVVEWDGGRIRASHIELAGRVTAGNDVGSTPSLSDHATHVAGTILAKGVNKYAKGMAPDATIVGYDFNDNYEEILNSLDTQEGILSNHSYGYLAGWTYMGFGYTWGGDPAVSSTIDYKFGYYSEYDAIIDEMLKYSPWHTFVAAAGNDRGEGPDSRPDGQELDGGATGYDTLPFGGVSKNTIVVGAVEPVMNYTGPNSVKMTEFSSWGPTDDGRILPTIVADGSNVYSSLSTDDNIYGMMSGTSMATPATTGALSLVQEFAKKKTGRYFTAPLIKSIVTNSAKEAGNPGPDYIYGFGLLDAKAAVETIDYKGKTTEYREGNLSNGEVITLTFKTQAGVPFKATVSWNDRAGTPKGFISDSTPKDPSYLNDRTPKLVDDLDMRVTMDGTEYTPYILDPENPANNATTGDNFRDNIEQIYIANPITGTVTLTIRHKGTLDNSGVDYGLVVSGIAVENDLMMESVTATVPQTEQTTGTSVVAKVKNVGSTDFGEYSVKFQVKNPSGFVIEEKSVASTGLAVGASQEITTSFNLEELFTTYMVTAEIVSNNDVIPGNNKSQALATPIVADLRQGGTMLLEDFNTHDNQDHAWEFANIDPTTPTWEWLGLSNFNLDGTQIAININGGKAADDWMLSNPVLLQQGSRYKVSYYTVKNSQNASRNENIEVYLAGEKTVGAMGTTPLHKYTWDQSGPNAEFVKVEFDFVAPTTGVQYFGIKHYSDAGKTSWLVGMEDFQIQNMEVGVPRPDFAFTNLDGGNVTTKYTEVQLVNGTYSNPEATAWKWEITPSTFEFVSGNDTSKDPVVKFSTEGEYTIKLSATNSYGTKARTKYAYVNVVAPTVTAGFTIDRNRVKTSENVQFTNITSGVPTATAYEWTITPNEAGAFTFLEGTSKTSEHLNVKFNKIGKYSVKLVAKTLDGDKTTEVSDMINVVGNTNPPTNVTATKDQSAVNITWDVPKTRYKDSFAEETFEGTFPPAGWQVLDNNNNSSTWQKLRLTDGTYAAGIFSYENMRPVQTDDYLVTNVINFLPEGYNELTFNSYGDPSWPDNMKIYFVKVADDSPLTAAQIQAGVKIFDGITQTDTSVFNAVSLGNNYDGSPFRLAFYSNNYDQFVLSLDNVKISAPGTVTQSVLSTSKRTAVSKKDLMTAEETADGVVNLITTSTSPKPNWPQIDADYSTNITSYEVFRNGGFLTSVPSADMVYVDNSITTAGNYCYSVVAIYDHVNKSDVSEEVCVDMTTLSAVDVNKATQFNAFPNPVVDVVKVKFAEKISGKAKVELYAMDGKKVLEQSLSEQQLLDEGVKVSHLNSGAYILVVNDGTKVHTTKIIKK